MHFEIRAEISAVETIATGTGIREIARLRKRTADAGEIANDEQDTRAIQHYLGHWNITHTVRYTELSPERFKGFWRD